MRAYWQDSRKPRYSLLVALPLFIIYQVLEALEPATHGGALRNGADVILETLFSRLAGPRGPLLLMVCLVAAGLWLVIRDYRKSGRELRFPVLVLMLGRRRCSRSASASPSARSRRSWCARRRCRRRCCSATCRSWPCRRG